LVYPSWRLAVLQHYVHGPGRHSPGDRVQPVDPLFGALGRTLACVVNRLKYINASF
jgi:hypothetical protein